MSIALGLPEHLTVRSMSIDDPGDLVARLPGPDAFAWLRRGDGLVGWGEAARIEVGPDGDDGDRFARAEAELRALFAAADVSDRAPGSAPRPIAFGSFTFDPRSPGSVLAVPRTVIGRRHSRSWLTTAGDGDGADGLAGVRPPLDPGAVRWEDGAVPPSGWQRSVEQAVRAVRAGRLGKVVLARDVYARTQRPIDARVLLRRLAAAYPDCFTFSCAGLIGATPELLVRRAGDRVSSLVLAGSAARSTDPGEDARLGAALLASAKDVDEHRHSVESVRAALAPLCAEITVQPAPSLLRLANVQHLATAVTGRLADRGTSALQAAAALHPTAAVCGTPTAAALPLLRELEHMDRGRYTGPVGWMDANGDGEWGIALRCAHLAGRSARLFAGGGIVAGSDPAAELAETEVKFRAMRDALEG